MIHDEICTYEVCKLAKEKGFPQDVFGTCEMKSACYLEDGRFCKDGCIYPIEDAYTAPTQSLLQRWLREEKKWNIVVRMYEDKGYYWFIQNSKGQLQESYFTYSDEMFDTYELALEDALEYTLENLV